MTIARRSLRVHVAVLITASLLSRPLIAATQPMVQQAGALKIIVITGEDAVNIIQQKTAVAPIVEVRDRNDQPIAGAVVNFAVRNGRATFSGARSLSITTDIAGRALATGLTPTGTGALEISASAVFQGQTATVTITQTNVLTAAQAAAVGGAQGGGTGAGTATGTAAGGSSGGGMSGLTIGAIAGGIGAGALVAAKAAGGGDPTSASNPQSAASPFEVEWTFEFGTNLFVIAQCPMYSGPPASPGIGPNGAGGRPNSDGTFSWVFSLLTPAAQLAGRFTQTDVNASIGCLGGSGPTGSLSGTGTLQEFRGNWNWGSQSGAFVARPRR